MDNTPPAHCLCTKALSFTYIASFVCCCSSVAIFHLVCYPSQKRSGTAANGMRSSPSQHSIACCAKFYKVNHCLAVTGSPKWPLASSGYYHEYLHVSNTHLLESQSEVSGFQRWFEIVFFFLFLTLTLCRTGVFYGLSFLWSFHLFLCWLREKVVLYFPEEF